MITGKSYHRTNENAGTKLPFITLDLPMIHDLYPPSQVYDPEYLQIISASSLDCGQNLTQCQMLK